MPDHPNTAHTIGWIGVGNMGRPLVTRLLQAGCDVAVYNRTRAKAEPLAELGATIVNTPRELADRDIVFSVVSGPADFLSVMTGEQGLLSDPDAAPTHIVDCSTISPEASSAVRDAAQARGASLVAAPVSGNGKHVAAGYALFAASGPDEAVAAVRAYLELLGRGVHHVGDGDAARLVKIAHNLFLGAVFQSMVETTLLVQASGIPRRTYLDFINDSALGSAFSAYKTPALVELDWTPTFTPVLLRKDLDLGLAAGEADGIVLPVTAKVRDAVQDAIDAGHVDDDFAAMLDVQAQAAGRALEPESLADREPAETRP